MKITNISAQAKNPDRVNVSVDGKYRFSLDVYQVVDLGVKVGKEYAEGELAELETESEFGKLYARALEYCLLRPHSVKEVREYLWRKMRTTKYKSKTGEMKERTGASKENTDRVLARLIEKGYVDDEKFARWWTENRHLKKGASSRKLTAELRAKGVEKGIIDAQLSISLRSDEEELRKVIAKKQNRYDDPQKLLQYLVRQGFLYDDVKAALSGDGPS